jgi:glycosyltransferase involved in cell wall biosynthesis
VTLHQIGDVDSRHRSTAAREVLFRAVAGRMANRVISVSDAVARHYARRGIPRGKLRVIHNAIDTVPFRRALGPDERDALRRELEIPAGARGLVCVAMLRPGKGIGVLVRAMRAVLEREPRAVLLIVGDGSERHRIEREIAAHELTGAVRLLGTRDDVPAILQLAELFVLPTRSALSAFPTVLIEACASGLPSVASNIGGVPEIVRDGKEAILTPVGDERALADALCTLLADQDLRSRLADGALARAGAFSVPAWAKAVLDVYDDVLARPAARRLGEPARS